MAGTTNGNGGGSVGVKPRIMALVHELLIQADGLIVPPVVVTITSGGGSVISFSCDLAHSPEIIKEAFRQNDLNAIDRAIVLAALTSPLSAKRLATLSGHKMSTHFSSALTRLVRRGLLIHTADGYALPPSV